jgi:hypothetical protein
MGGMTSQVCWKQAWGTEAEGVLVRSLAAIGSGMQEIASQDWDPKTGTIGGLRDTILSSIGQAGDHWSSVLLQLDALFGEPLAKAISAVQSGPAILFLEFDQATWGYVLYEGAREVDKLWSDPEYVDEPAGTSTGDPALVASIVGVSRKMIEPYLTQTPGDEKAFPDDEFSLDDHWVRTDFMRRLGITYPDFASNRWVLIADPESNNA